MPEYAPYMIKFGQNSKNFLKLRLTPKILAKCQFIQNQRQNAKNFKFTTERQNNAK